MPLAWLSALLARHSAWQALTVFCTPAAGGGAVGAAVVAGVVVVVAAPARHLAT